MHVLTPPTRLIALLLAIVLAASACSAGSDGAAPADEEASAPANEDAPNASEPAGRDTNGVSLDPDCAAAEEANTVIRRDNGWLGSITDAAGLLDGLDEPRDLQPLADAVAALRPFQDLESDDFGSMREALDSIQSNIDAAEEGRFGDIESVAVVVVIGVTVGEVICG